MERLLELRRVNLKHGARFRVRTGAFLIVASLATLRLASAATTFTVTATADNGPGSLRQAIIDANAAAGLDTIAFSIAGTGVHTISPLSDFPTITEPVIVDGYTQPGASQNTLADGNDAVLLIELNGSSAPGGAIGLKITAGTSTVRGLVINNFSGSGIQLGEGTNGGNIISGNFIGTDAAGTTAQGNGNGIFLFSSPGNTIGGTTPGARNVISGNRVALNSFVTSSNVIQGNYFGTDRSGTAVVAVSDQGAAGINLTAVCDNNQIGGTAAGARNIISGIRAAALTLQGTVGNVVEGNYIGTDVTGNVALGNALNNQSACAVCVVGNRNPFGTGGGPGTDNRIGGTTSGAGNVIAGYQGGTAAIFIGGSSAGDSRRANSNIVQGNFIGTNRDGTIALPNRGIGVYVQDGDDNLIGGTVPGAANLIRNSAVGSGGNGSGVAVSSGVRNRILGNSISDSGKLGIDLGFGGSGLVTPNDATDADTGANDLQNFPVITEASVAAGNVTLRGRLDSTASRTFRLEFFGSARAGVSGYGEGQTFLGSTDVTTDAGGAATFDVTLPNTSGIRSFAASATDAAGNTSEFSPAFRMRLLNISTRMRVLPGDNALIAGFIITGGDPKKVIVRGLGPSITGVGSDALVDPVLELDQPGVFPTVNDNWRDTQETEIEASTIPPPNNAEAAIVATLQPGAYTAVLREKNNVPGAGLVEVYDLSQSAGSELANISTRGFVQTDDNVMIGGFIIAPEQIGKSILVVRALGPSLTEVPTRLEDPTVELFDGNGTSLQFNNDWKDTQQAALDDTGIAPSNEKESAMIVSVGAGNYTAIVRGKDDTTGVGLVEIYKLP